VIHPFVQGKRVLVELGGVGAEGQIFSAGAGETGVRQVQGKLRAARFAAGQAQRFTPNARKRRSGVRFHRSEPGVRFLVTLEISGMQ